MSRTESDREDLLREATALVERIELTASDDALGMTTIVAGFRKDGALSLFFDADPVYQFNAAGELRRAFCDGRLYKADRTRLVSLDRHRTATEVQLLRQELTADEKQAFLANMQRKLHALTMLLERGDYTVIGQVPPTADVLPRVQAWLTQHTAPRIAPTPRV
jgi:hypothetical protein